MCCGRIDLPNKSGAATPVAESAEIEPADSTTTAPARGQRTVLVVEDEGDVREIATVFLRSAD
jgi:hypothetical protein